MSLCWPHKDPDEVLDYRLDWLGTTYKPGPLFGTGDAISNSLWVVPAGLASENETHDGGSVTIWLSGGADGESYAILNRITTAAGRVFDQTINLPVRQK
jgi:hypothetical protein